MSNRWWPAFKRFWTVIRLFLCIFWAFYSLRFKKFWHSAEWIEKSRHELARSQARRFRETAVDLGGLLIKLGQFFSTRVDLLPPSSIEELSLLQDEVKSVPFTQLRDLAESEFAAPLDHVFESIAEQPLASASLGQVHLGRLSTGETVAVKIQRPGIEDLVATDLKAVGRIVQLIRRFTNWERFIDLEAIYKEFSETLWDELDYLKEGKNAETISANNQDDQDLIIPRIYWQYTTRRVLTMEYIEGIKVTDLDGMARQGINRQVLASRLLQVYIKQVLIDGFFHADPHPGNLFVSSDGKLIMIDFGMVGRIPADQRDTLIEMVFAMVNRDFPKVVEYLKIVGFIRYDAEERLIIRAVSLFLEQALGNRQELSQKDLNAILKDLEVLLYEQPFQVPANFTFLGRALGTLYGICVKLDPDISFLDVARPYIDQISPKEKSLWKIVREKGPLWGFSLIEIPLLAEKVLRKADIGELTLRIPLDDIKEEIIHNSRSNRGIAWMLAFGFTLLTSAYLKINQESRLSLYSLAASILFLIISALSFRRRTRAPRRIIRHPQVIPRWKRNDGKD